MGISKTVKYLDRSGLEVQLKLIAQRHLKDAVVISITDVLYFQEAPVVTGTKHYVFIFIGDADRDGQVELIDLGFFAWYQHAHELIEFVNIVRAVIGLHLGLQAEAWLHTSLG